MNKKDAREDVMENTELTIVHPHVGKVRVYLSGGFHTDWQQQVMAAVGTEKFYFLNPLQKETAVIDGKPQWKNIKLTEEQKEERSIKQRQCPWWQQDKLAIQKADVVFCHLEDYRPKMLGGGGIFELGMAYMLGKAVILVNKIEHRYYREFERLFISFPSLEEGIEELKKFGWLR